MNKRLTKVSKYLTFVLRHEPHSIGITLDENGFVDVATLVAKANEAGKSITAQQVLQVGRDHEDKLFTLSDDESRIRLTELG